MHDALERWLKAYKAGMAEPPSVELAEAFVDIAQASLCLVEAGWSLPAVASALERIEPLITPKEPHD